MRPIPVLLYVLLFSILSSCEDSNKKDVNLNPSWQKLSLPNGWVIYTPKEFKVRTVQGVDSEPGFIYSKKDSIRLEFDSGQNDNYYYKHCNLHENFLRAKANINTGLYKNTYKVPLINRADIDTIDGRISLMITPIYPGHGMVMVSTGECDQGAWLAITGTNLSDKQEKLALEIYKTIRFTQTNQ